jgi:uncharacterized membrane protein
MLKPDRVFFALGLIGLGVLSLVYGDFALQWQPVPALVPGREYLAYASGAVMVAGGAGLLSRRTAVLSSGVLFATLPANSGIRHSLRRSANWLHLSGTKIH